MLYLYPEPRAVFGPHGPRGVPATDSSIAPIVLRIERRATPTPAQRAPTAPASEPEQRRRQRENHVELPKAG